MIRRTLFGLVSAAALITSANAADIGGYKDGPYTAGPVWTGFYAGAHAGGVWGDVDLKDVNGGVAPGPFSFSASGAFGGGTAGYNFQRGNFVFGVEGDIGYMDLSGSRTIPSSDPAKAQNVTLDGGLYGDIGGRLGYAFAGTLLYAKGGFAFYDGEAKQVTTKPGYKPTATNTFTGWTVGGGVEHYISRAWSVKAEYLHFDFGTEHGAQTSISDAPIGFVYKNSFDVTADSVKVGLNYHPGSSYEPLK
jgi:outer membrane immunogenic protein